MSTTSSNSSPPEPGQASLKDIAARTNLTVASVSRILRNKGQWSPRTRDRVQQVASELRYRPNRLVRAMQGLETQTIGVMFAWPSPYYAHVVSGIQQGRAEQDYLRLSLGGWLQMRLPDSDAATEQEREFQWIHRLIEHRVDGVIFGPVALRAGERHLQEIRDHRLDVVTVDFEMQNAEVDYVGSDDVLGGRQAAEHLLERGHRRLGCVLGSAEWPTAVRRMQGCRAAVRGVADASLQLFECNRGTLEEGERAGELLDQPDRPTAIIATTDVLACGLYRAAAARGLRVPHDLSIIAFGPSLETDAINPPLTLMHQQPEQVGLAAARRMIELRRQDDNRDLLPERLLIPPELSPAGSVAPPPPTG